MLHVSAAHGNSFRIKIGQLPYNFKDLYLFSPALGTPRNPRPNFTGMNGRNDLGVIE
jgi:hypothetical protein